MCDFHKRMNWNVPDSKKIHYSHKEQGSDHFYFYFYPTNIWDLKSDDKRKNTFLFILDAINSAWCQNYFEFIFFRFIQLITMLEYSRQIFFFFWFGVSQQNNDKTVCALSIRGCLDMCVFDCGYQVCFGCICANPIQIEFAFTASALYLSSSKKFPTHFASTVQSQWNGNKLHLLLYFSFYLNSRLTKTTLTLRSLHDCAPIWLCLIHLNLNTFWPHCEKKRTESQQNSVKQW